MFWLKHSGYTFVRIEKKTGNNWKRLEENNRPWIEKFLGFTV